MDTIPEGNVEPVWIFKLPSSTRISILPDVMQVHRVLSFTFNAVAYRAVV